MSGIPRQTSGLSGWLRDHLVGRLRDEVDCQDAFHEESALRAVTQARRERLPFDAYRGFSDPRERPRETDFQPYRA